jgi:hypothetical protein
MSTTSLTKAMRHSLSPALTKSRKMGKHSINSSAYHEPEAFKANFKLAQSMSQFPNHLSKLIKISEKKIETKPNLIAFHLRETGKNNLFMTSEVKNTGIEEVIKKKLRKEEKLTKKIEVFRKFCDKLAVSSKSFKACSGVFNEIFDLVLKELKELNRLRKSQANLNEICDNIQNEIDLVKDENERLAFELEKIRGEDRALKNTCKKQSVLLNQMKCAGLPVEEFYQKIRNADSKAKTLSRVNIRVREDERVDIPKLILKENKESEGYQEEFMSKFKEFSESWRDQIIKNHHKSN